MMFFISMPAVKNYKLEPDDHTIHKEKIGVQNPLRTCRSRMCAIIKLELLDLDASSTVVNNTS